MKKRPTMTATMQHADERQYSAPDVRGGAGFVAIVAQYQRPIYTFPCRMSGNPDDAADLTQETFLKAYRAIAATDAELNVGAWLYRIATNTCRDLLRRRARIAWLPWDADAHERPAPPGRPRDGAARRGRTTARADGAGWSRAAPASGIVAARGAGTAPARRSPRSSASPKGRCAAPSSAPVKRSAVATRRSKHRGAVNLTCIPCPRSATGMRHLPVVLRMRRRYGHPHPRRPDGTRPSEERGRAAPIAVPQSAQAELFPTRVSGLRRCSGHRSNQLR